MRYLFGVIFLFPAALSASIAYGQLSGRIFRTDATYISGIKVSENNVQKPLAWTGGLNHPQFATVELNKDGKKDLVVYEVTDVSYGTAPLSNNIKTFLNIGTPGSTQYQYAPEYEYLFPDPGRFMKLLDYNCDGIPDYLYGAGFLNICDGYYNSNNSWSCTNCRPIRYVFPQGTNSSEVPVLGDDVPGIADLNHDQDLDLVTFSVLLNGRLELYRNMRYEDGMPCDSVKFKFKDRCWGKVKQDAPRTHLLNLPCDNTGLKPSGDQNKVTHGSNGVCLFDADGDGDYDALIGNSYYSDIQFLKNGKVEYNYPVDTIISQDTTWPSSGHKAYMPSYPMAYWIDVDDDADKDIIIAPQSSGQNYASVALYRNAGSDATPSFVYQKDSFLVDEMVDAGSNSYPFLYDYNRDGKKDLFIGARGYFQPDGSYKTSLLYLENMSSAAGLSFNLVTRNFLDIGAFTEQGAAIAIGDLDNDGLDDLVAGRLDGSIICFKNHAVSAAAQPDWQLWQSRLKATDGSEIHMGNYAVPFIYDIDKDGKNDLIVGNATGYLTFYKNVGAGQIGLEYKTNKLGGVKALPDEPQGYSAPYIGPIDNSGTHYLMVGSGTGAICRYTGFQNGNVTSPYTLMDTLYSEIKIPGQLSSMSFADLSGDSKYELFIGNSRGGVFAYRQVWDDHIDEMKMGNGRLDVFPNPAKNKVRMTSAQDISAFACIRLFDNIGRMYMAPFAVAGKVIDIDVSGLPAGIYWYRVSSDNNEFKGVFVKE